MEQNKWQITLHEDCEDPYYEITNGLISLIANCGFVGEDDADEENIFRRVFDALDQSGIDFHSGNPLELEQHIEILERGYKIDELQAKCDQAEQLIEFYKRKLNSEKDFFEDGYKALQAKCERYEKALKEIAENKGTCCMRCEGNGKLWADGQAHLPSYDGPTVNCGNCGGSGRIHDDLQEIANEALSGDGKNKINYTCNKCGYGNANLIKGNYCLCDDCMRSPEHL
jgi:hypothetical protein